MTDWSKTGTIQGKFLKWLLLIYFELSSVTGVFTVYINFQRLNKMKSIFKGKNPWEISWKKVHTYLILPILFHLMTTRSKV